MNFQELRKIYDEGMLHDLNNALQQVYLAAVAETHKVRDDLAGVDVQALQAENVALKAQVVALTLAPAPVVETTRAVEALAPTEQVIELDRPVTTEPNAGPGAIEGVGTAT